MKKVLFAISTFALLMGAASCQTDDLGGIEKSSVDNPLNTITVKMGNSTRLGIDDTNTPYFEEGDEVFGWDATGSYTYQCTSVSGTEATFSRTSDYAPSADEGTKVNLVFAKGADATDIVDSALSIDISTQNASSFEELPIVMTASGEVDASGKCSMSFTNETSVIKVTDCVTDEVEGVEFDYIEADNLFPQMTISLDANGNMVKTPGTTPGTITNKGGFTAGADGKISTFIATFPTQGSATEISFSAKTSNRHYYKFNGGSKTINSNSIIKLAGKSFTACMKAKIEETSTAYYTLDDAIAAAGSSPVTITILEDCVSGKIETAADGTNDITLDLNGKTVEAYISLYGKMTVGDSSTDKTGVFKTAKTWSQAFYLRTGCELVINSGTIVDPSDDNPVIHTVANSTVTVNGGKLEGKQAIYLAASTSVVNVNGGYFKGETGIFDLYGAGKLTIKDGYFDGELVTGNKKTANTVTKGGYYTVEPNFASTGYAPKQLTSSVTKDGVTYNYIIAEYNAMMSVAGVEYESVTDAITAINNATSDVTVKFLQNISLEQEIVINNANAKVTLDLNGKTVRAHNASGVSAVVVEGASTVVDFIDSVGGGMYDHTYSGTAYTLTVKAGTANLISGNISNMTTTGYGRVAVRVLAKDAPAYFNMTGGEIHGGRAIRFGGASETVRAYVTISGGLVEGRNTDNGSYYSAISFEESGWGTLLVNGGTIKGNTTKAVIYIGSSVQGENSITITKGPDGKIPYLYTDAVNSEKKYVIAAGSTTIGGKTFVNEGIEFYSNSSSMSYTGLSVNKEELSSVVKDEYNYSYGWHFTEVK